MSKDIAFSGYLNSLSKIPIQTSFLQEMESIKNGDYEKEVQKAREIRLLETDEAYKKFRRENVYCFSVGVNSSKTDSRADPSPDELTGLFCLDIDDIHQDQKANKEKLKTFQWVLAVGHSIGGVGLFAIIKGDPGHFQDSHRSAVALLAKEGIKVAGGQQDENRLRYGTWDPGICYSSCPGLAPNVPILPKEEKKIEIAASFQNNDQEHIFKTILKVKAKGIQVCPAGERHAFLISVAGWCNRIGMTEEFCVEMAEKHCPELLEDGRSYPIAGHILGEYKSYPLQFNTWKWDGSGLEPIASTPEFIPDWNNRPAYVPPVLKLAGINILTYQNISTITAAPGSGKTSCIEAVGASFLNPLADCLGFEVDGSCKGVLIIDTERTKTDVWNSFYRMCRRADIQEGTGIGNVRIVGMRGISSAEERKKTIEKHITTKEFNLLLIDGAADLVSDTNNVDQAKAAQDWLRYLTTAYDLSILATIHPNPGSTKARGHTGGEMLRDSETVLLIKDFEGAKIITSDFEHGKNRNTAKLTSGFQWSDEKMMFVSVDYQQLTDNKRTAKRVEAEKMAKKLLQPPNSMKYTELVFAVMNETGKGERTAESRVKEWTAWQIINKSDEYYRLVV